MSLTTPESVQKLQTALHDKAKKSPDFRFYALYDKVYRKDVLTFAYECCKAKGGAAGVDGQTFEDIEAYGAERWMDELTQELKSRTYQPLPVRRVYIPKPGGQKRPLGVPAIRDRAVMMAVVLVLHHSLPHSELLKSVARRVVDGAMLHLVKMWLKAPVEETDERGKKHRSTRNRDEGRGTPQGSPISPLLSNLYMRRFVLGWKKLGHEERLGAYIVNYADDLVICCRGRAEEALATMRVMMTKLKLTVNETKTRVSKLPEEKFDFLGYTFGRCYSPKTGRAYLGTVPAKKRVIRICKAISNETGRNRTLLDHQTIVTKLNQMMNGWANYFCLGPVSKAYQAVDQHTCKRLRQWLCAKHKEAGSATRKYSDVILHDRFGLVRLTERTRNFSWAKS